MSLNILPSAQSVPSFLWTGFRICLRGAHSGSNLDTRTGLGPRYVITGSGYSIRVTTIHELWSRQPRMQNNPAPPPTLSCRSLPITLQKKLPRSSVLNGGVASCFPSLYQLLTGRDPTEIGRITGEDRDDVPSFRDVSHSNQGRHLSHARSNIPSDSIRFAILPQGVTGILTRPST